MKKLKFNYGIIEVYDTEKEMIGILSEQLGKDEVDWALKDERFKDSFNPNTNGSHYIKKVIAIKVPDEAHKTLICFEHWNYERNCDLRKNVEINMNTYSSGFACTSFKKPNENKQKCFIEYYNTVRDDDRIEKILNTFKVGDKLYFKDYSEHTLSSETINYIGLDCYEQFVVEIGTNERENKFAINRIKEDGSCDSYCDKTVCLSLENAKESCLKDLQTLKEDYLKRICDINEKINKTLNYKG